MANPEEILAYWLDELGPQGWYRGGEALDQEIRDRFGATLIQAQQGALGLWLTYATGTLAYIILTDQFSRNIHRNQGKAFSTDRAAITAAKTAIGRGWDMRVDEPARHFFYMPLMHSENLCDQDRCVRLMLTRLPESGALNLVHAKAHREIIRQFGRFPFRNAALSRVTTCAESAFMNDGAYGAIVEGLKGKQAA
jgi:uncharacterized protein (DUF924 family)